MISINIASYVAGGVKFSDEAGWTTPLSPAEATVHSEALSVTPMTWEFSLASRNSLAGRPGPVETSSTSSSSFESSSDETALATVGNVMPIIFDISARVDGPLSWIIRKTSRSLILLSSFDWMGETLFIVQYSLLTSFIDRYRIDLKSCHDTMLLPEVLDQIVFSIELAARQARRSTSSVLKWTDPSHIDNVHAAGVTTASGGPETIKTALMLMQGGLGSSLFAIGRFAA